MGTLASVRVANPSGRRRTSMVSVGVPFLPGQYRDTPLAIGNDSAPARQASVRDLLFHPDGSVRWAAIDAVVDIEPNTEAVFRLWSSLDEPKPFAYADNLAEAHGMWSLVPRGMRPVGTELLQSTSRHKMWRAIYRSDDGLRFVWITLQVAAECPSAKFWVDAFWFGQDGRPAGGEILLDALNVEMVFNHASRVGVEERSLASRGFGYAQTVSLGSLTGDAQSRALEGTLLFWTPSVAGEILASLEAEKAGGLEASPLVAVCEDWPQRPYLAPVATPADMLPPNQAANAEARRGYSQFQGPNDQGPFGLNKYPGAPGAQYDFGVVNQMCWQAAMGASPAAVHALQLSVMRESLRPCQFLEDDGTPFLHAFHPHAYFWDGRPGEWSWVPDKLGRPTNPGDTQGWRGRDRQHYSVNQEVGYALLSGNPWVMGWLDRECDRWLAAIPVNSVSPVLNSVGSPRAGRLLQGGALLCWATEREDVRDRLRDRVLTNHKRLWEEGDGFTPAGYQGVTMHGPEQGHVLKNHWVPWEVGMHITGLAFVRQVVQNEAAEQLLDTLVCEYSDYWLRHGWQREPLAVAYWRVAETPEAHWEPGFNTWMLGALGVAAKAGKPEALHILEKLEHIEAPHWRIPHEMEAVRHG